MASHPPAAPRGPHDLLQEEYDDDDDDNDKLMAPPDGFSPTSGFCLGLLLLLILLLSLMMIMMMEMMMMIMIMIVTTIRMKSMILNFEDTNDDNFAGAPKNSLVSLKIDPVRSFLIVCCSLQVFSKLLRKVQMKKRKKGNICQFCQGNKEKETRCLQAIGT